MRHKPRIVAVEEIIEETPTIKTFIFKSWDMAESFLPGHFIMVWVPSLDEVPMSISKIEPSGLIGFTVAKVGEATEALHNLKKGSRIGVRGPYGKPFEAKDGKVLAIGGGVGMAPLMPLIKKLKAINTEVTVIIGAKTTSELPFINELRELDLKKEVCLIPATEDGSYGERGLASNVAERLLKKKAFDEIYTCGPELMMLKVFKLAEKYDTPIQASLERIVKCGIGICGSCCISKYRVCKDGPVFSTKQLREMIDEFGKFKRNFTGKKVRLL